MQAPNRKILLTFILGFLVLASLTAVIMKFKGQTNEKTVAIESEATSPENSAFHDTQDSLHGNDHKAGAYFDQEERWEAFLKTELDWKKPVGPQVEAFRVKYGVPVVIWGEGEDAIPDYKIGPHPCGKIKTIFTGSLNSPDGKPFLLGRVLEIKDKKITNTWRLPIDEVPLAIERENILIDYSVTLESNSTILQMTIQPNGQFIIEDKKFEDTFSPESYLECPQFEGDSELRSDFTRCYEYQDISNKEKRLLVFEQPCT